MNFDFKKAKQQVNFVDEMRLMRAIKDAPAGFATVLQLLPLFFHCNHPSLVGYVKDCPQGICDFTLSNAQKEFLQMRFPQRLNAENCEDFIALHNDKDYPESAVFRGIYVMGSIGTVTQTPNSDLDIWLCARENLTPLDASLLKEKISLLQKWALNLGVKISLYLLNEKRFRDSHYASPLSAEQDNSGSAQYMLLLDEFYRTALRLAGKPILWLHLPVECEKDYDKKVKEYQEAGKIDLNDWVDFGGLGKLSPNEYFGATLWQLYKGIDSPYKSALKILLLESYSAEYPHTQLISQEFKQRLLKGETDYHFDAYLCMLERVSRYLFHKNEHKRLKFAYRCFYLKIAENQQQEKENKPNWRLDYLHQLVQKWHWTKDFTDFLDNRSHWGIKFVKQNHNDLLQYLMASYRNLLQFVRQYKINASIVPQDMAILSRKLYTAFEELPGKVIFINTAIASDLAEKVLTFVEVKNNPIFKAGWYLLNHEPNLDGFHVSRHAEFSETLPKLVAWSYFNGLLTPETKLYTRSQSVRLPALSQFAQDLCRTFPREHAPASKQALIRHCKIRQLFIAVNLSNDVTKNLDANNDEHRKTILAGDLFNLKHSENPYIGSIDAIYRNRWNEIRTLHFEGDDALIRLIKVLTHKIPRASTSLQAVNIFSYAENYSTEIQQTIQTLIYRTLGIESQKIPSENNMASIIRYTGHGWSQLFQQSAPKVAFNSTFLNKNNAECTPYPKEVAQFASEGFLQFFFEDNQDNSFNVYILDERNHIEVYRSCLGDKSQKINEINQLYQAASLNTEDNPYRIIKYHFNYPQFYQLLPSQDTIQIVPFRHHLKMI